MKEHHAHVMSPEYEDIQEIYIKKEADAVIAELKLNIKGWQQENTDLQDKIAELEDSIFKHGHEITVLQARVDKRDERIDELVELLKKAESELGCCGPYHPLLEPLQKAINKYKQGM